MTSYQTSRHVAFTSLTWPQMLCLAFLRLPRLVPRSVLPYTTSPERPYPRVLRLPSREPGRKIYCWIFLPEQEDIDRVRLARSRRGGDQERQSEDNELPIIIDFHGGGFTMGQLSEQAPWCSLISRRTASLVITVDYRMGPLDRYPCAIHDAEDVVRSCVDESFPGYAVLRDYLCRSSSSTGSPLSIDNTRIATSGFSSGGNLSLNLLISPPDWPSPLERSCHPHPIPALLFYPSLDARQLVHERPRPPGMAPFNPESWGGWLTKQLDGCYLESWQRGEIRASPGLATLGSDKERRRAVGKLIDLQGEDRDEATAAEGRREAHDVVSSTKGTDTGMLHPQAHCLLILPSQDTLAAQSRIWLEALASAGRTTDDDPSSTLGVTPIFVPDTPHGWTQMPDFVLTASQRESKYRIFDQAVDFVERVWSQS